MARSVSRWKARPANRGKPLLQHVMQAEFSTLDANSGLPRNFRDLKQRLIALAA